MNKSDQLESSSYMEFRFDEEGKEAAVFLRIPTFWDEINTQYVLALKFSDGYIMKAFGKDNFALQNASLVELHKLFMNPNYHEELFAMLKPLEFWEKE